MYSKLISILFVSCICFNEVQSQPEKILQVPVKAIIITDTVKKDADDPAVWVNKKNLAGSLIIGTDKDMEGGLYVFDLNGKVQEDKTIHGLKRPDNVDVEYGLKLNGKKTDIAVTTERLSQKLRIFSLPDMHPIDNGGIDMFENEIKPGYRDLMGIALYKNKKGIIYAIVGRKTGPLSGYLWQYKLEDDGKGYVKGTLIRKFGNFSGRKEIESIMVDDDLGYIYYSDEGFGVRKYYAEPDKGDQELALFATSGFTEDHEGISLYKLNKKLGYILVSDQGANKFQIFGREGSKKNPHQHELLDVVTVDANHSDGSETIAKNFNQTFRKGLFVAMSDDRTYHIYRWEDIAGSKLKSIHQ